MSYFLVDWIISNQSFYQTDKKPNSALVQLLLGPKYHEVNTRIAGLVRIEMQVFLKKLIKVCLELLQNGSLLRRTCANVVLIISKNRTSGLLQTVS